MTPTRRSLFAAALLLVASTVPSVAAGDSPAGTATVTCGAATGARQHCPCDTTAGVVLRRSTGEKACLLGKTWGYDDTGIWVTDGCAGEFVVARTAAEGAAAPAPPPPEGEAAPAPEPEPADRAPTPQLVESWGEFEPGSGFLVGRTSAGELSISAYALVRYIDQLPSGQTFTDHLGNEQPVDKPPGLLPPPCDGLPEGLGRRSAADLTRSSLDREHDGPGRDLGTIGYQFSRHFSLYGGLNGLPGRARCRARTRTGWATTA